MKIQRRFAPTGGLFEPDSVACFPGMRNKHDLDATGQ
jgi:hypothetical protein